MEIKGIDGLISLAMLYDTEFIIDYTQKVLLFPKEKLTGNKVLDIQLFTHADQSLDISTYILLNNKYKINVLPDSGAGNDSFWLIDRLMNILESKKKSCSLLKERANLIPQSSINFTKEM